MLFNRPWLRNAKITHDWKNNMIMIQGNVIVRTIVATKHLSSKLKRLEILLCFDYQNGITNEEEDLMFVSELLFSISTINLPLNTMDIVIVNRM